MAETHNNENTCVVCFKNVLYYSIGECDHPVCFECSTRMRVLCLQNECPICRQDLLKVLFTESILPYKELRNRVIPDRLFERQYKIGFCNEDIKHAYERLLENRCKICDKLPPFRTFTMLNDHMRKVHERYFCDLCVKHLKIFTNERKCYTRQELGHHRRKGDLDDTSHRGHPLCKFCEERFMDADELYRHMRKEHLYCHLCDADGSNQYYSSHPELARHFRDDHFLCEEGECAEQHLTSVFRTDIDLKAHKATVHGRGMARGAARQARTLELQFNITPHPGVQRATRERVETPSNGGSSNVATTTVARIDTRSDEQFPRLSASSAPTNLVLTAPTRTYRGSEGLARTERNFPALDGGGGGGAGGAGGAGVAAPTGSGAPPRAPPRTAPATVAATIVRNTKPSVSIQLHSQPASASNFRLTQTSSNRISIPPAQRKQPQPLCDDDFPSLGHVPRDDHPSIGASTPQPSKVAVINSQETQAIKNNNHSSSQHKKPQLSAEAFPALSSTSAPAAPPQWITVSKPKEKNKPVKTEQPPPQPRQPAFNAVADFPTLPANNNKMKVNKKSSVATQQTPQPTPNNEKPSKKEKKKQNMIKKEILSENITREIPLVNGLDKKYARDPSFTEVNSNNIQTVERDRKIKTIETSSTVTVNTVNTEKNKNGGNGDFALAARDYPPLNPKCDTKSNSGSWIEHSVVKKVPNGSVPPGFKPCDMTFTNSSGQTFPAPVHKYIPPPEFEQRNCALVGKLATLGGNDALDSFKHASRAFREGVYGAEEFTGHCRATLGDKLDEVFPELVALLPDIRKQQELALCYAVPLHVCATCGQLLAPIDEAAHDAKHWPPLSSR